MTQGLNKRTQSVRTIGLSYLVLGSLVVLAMLATLAQPAAATPGVPPVLTPTITAAVTEGIPHDASLHVDPSNTEVIDWSTLNVIGVTYSDGTPAPGASATPVSPGSQFLFVTGTSPADSCSFNLTISVSDDEGDQSNNSTAQLTYGYDVGGAETQNDTASTAANAAVATTSRTLASADSTPLPIRSVLPTRRPQPATSWSRCSPSPTLVTTKPCQQAKSLSTAPRRPDPA